MKKYVFLLLLIVSAKIQAQNYTLYSTGSLADTVTKPKSATLLMGGATENDSVMKKFLQYADGGDIVVIRASGADGYNYFYTDLEVYVHSVKTFVINTIAGANDSVVVQAVRNAEAVWIAGGNQYSYVQFWRGTALNTTLNTAINTKRIPIGGTSAGMVIQGSHYFSAQNGSVTSTTALANPYDASVTVDATPFINNVHTKDLITDTHFDNPDRKGRLMTFLARTWKDNSKQINAIACDEYTAVWLDSNGIGYVYGSTASDHAYFITIDCEGDNSIENCTSGQALNWNRDGKVVKVYDVVGNNQGTGFYDLKNFKKNNFNGAGGTWQDWSVDNGVFKSANAVVYNCATAVKDIFVKLNVDFYPNPSSQILYFQNNESTNCDVIITNTSGKIVHQQQIAKGKTSMNLQAMAKGIYIVNINNGVSNMYKKLVVN
jgi:cyanophycinase-like exopeptidase